MPSSTLSYAKERVYETFWFFPTLITITLILSSFSLIYLDYLISLQFITEDFYKQLIGEASARTTLSVIATSVITVTGVTFSITVLTLSIVSNQLGHRLLPNFMRLKVTQTVLGLFIGTFIYVLIALQAIGFFKPHLILPYCTIVFGTFLGIVCFFALIYFIHRIYRMIQVDSVIDFIALGLMSSLNELLLKKEKVKNIHTIINKCDEGSNSISSHRFIMHGYSSNSWGYVQAIDDNSLVDYAINNEGYVKLLCKPGDFIFTNMHVLKFTSDKKVSQDIIDKCVSCIKLGSHRATVSDIEFSFEQLSEIAVRALSPGINSPYTAIHSIDRMMQGFSLLKEKDLPECNVIDDDGIVRLIKPVISYEGIVRTSLNKIRQQAVHDLSVSIHIISMIAKLVSLDSLPIDFKKSLILQAEETYAAIDKKQLSKSDLDDLDCCYNSLQNEIS